jgi:tetratricopeptide (TPR) repeat protein
MLVSGCASMGGSRAEDTDGASERDLRIIQYQPESAHEIESELLYQLLAGELAGQMGAVDESVVHYLEAARISRDPKIAGRATRIALFAGDIQDAVKSAQRWVQLAPDNLEARQTLAVLYTRAGESQQAIPHFQYVISASKKRGANGFTVIGATLAREKNHRQALDVMQQLVNLYADDPRAHFAYANLALAAKQYQMAVEASGRALALAPTMVEALTVRAQAYLSLGESKLALKDMKSAVKAVPESYELRVNYGRMLVQAKRYSEAREIFNQLLKDHPGEPDLIYTMGLLNLQEQNFDEAVKNFKRLVKTGKRADEGHYYLGRVAEERKRYKEAMSWYLKVGEGDYYLDAQSRVAGVYVKLGSLQKARDHLKRARSQADDEEVSIRLYLAEGQLLREAKLYNAGMALYSRALTEHPGNGDLLYSRALMAEKIDRIDLLEADLRAILAEDPNNATALNALGYTLADRNERIEEAFAYIQRALKAKPDDPTVIDSMGWVQFRMGNINKAEQYLRRAFELLQDGEIAGHLSEIIWVKGNKSEARALIREALKREPEHEYLLELRQRFTQ